MHFGDPLLSSTAFLSMQKQCAPAVGVILGALLLYTSHCQSLINKRIDERGGYECGVKAEEEEEDAEAEEEREIKRDRNRREGHYI